jgi:ribosome biogenesis GTPase / thiamine phosphate phosphatase
VTLAELGYDAWFAAAFEPYGRKGLIPARVGIRHHGPCVLFTEEGDLGGIPAGRLDEDDLPAVGDWVAARPLPGERKALIEAILPRRSAFTRKEAWRRTVEQVLAANVDVALVLSSLGPDLNVRRLERYVTAAWESGAEPVVLLTKADLADDVERGVSTAEGVAPGVPVWAVSSVTGEGLDAVRALVAPNRTAVLLGSSGVGKSTLANRLVGHRLLATAEIGADGRGRHTTTHRQLVVLPGGGVLLDTPGLRELQLWAGEESLGKTFEDVESLAAECRFGDCRHEREPGCAVTAALADGRLAAERLASFRKLQREIHALAVRQSARATAEERRKRRREARSRRKPVY